MTEYWISKKQYWCKFCSIYIRDDAPSRRQHESGLKHQGNKERFIRDLYRGGEKAKKEKAEEAREMARIEAAASAAHAQDTASGYLKASSSTPSSTAVAAPAPKTREKPTDKWSNYSTAAQLGFVDEEDAKKTAYEIELEIKGQAGEAGQWEEVILPPPAPIVEAAEVTIGEKRPREEDEEGEGWRFEHKGKKPVFDPYDDDWDPSSLKSLKVKRKEGASSEDAKVAAEETATEVPRVKYEKEAAEIEERGLKREGWSGKLEWNTVMKETGTSKEVKEEADVRGEVAKATPEQAAVPARQETVKSEPEVELSSVPESTAASGGGMFKKRRPPPSNRKK
ncbi:hypothetical protein L202_07523 [Cryptococcus amylolentus CBS 6039]|uniref:Matrin-type domain-containing protein n=2 Tax=Cryptococcus amylolentus TaxID=104669 RepID=A0A1E3HCJ3_9TREE|nr:hypothetical protein L202_07523 [Cryptococcus amylolentus CBS 6039]ODN74053.1 hypothetical protein L202_07523 [Cryptococcus amylolentus CBS 6039]ODO00152.1 hypothetical protein I350_06777 [Cryptococcus amylolentus CBS 6273]